MKILVLFAFVVLGCSLAGARNVTKCELRQQLKVAFTSLPNNVTIDGLTEDTFIAKVVCHVESLSGFDTNAVTNLSQGQEDSTENGSSQSKKRDKKRGKGKGKGKGNEDNLDATLYGLFQLPDNLVCANSTSLCGISCNKLADDDISDDIDCVVKVIRELLTKGFLSKNSKDLWKVVKNLVGDNCKNVDQYFSDC